MIKIKVNYKNENKLVQEYKKFIDDFDKMSDEEKMNKYDYFLWEYRSKYAAEGIKRMESEIKIKELEKKLADIELKNNQKDMRLIDAVIDAIYDTDIDFYNKLVRNVKFGEEEIIIKDK